MEQIVEQGMLYDFYGPLLTKHQQEIYELVVYQNLSLNEIAEQNGISKQAVSDLVRRATAQMQGYEIPENPEKLSKAFRRGGKASGRAGSGNLPEDCRRDSQGTVDKKNTLRDALCAIHRGHSDRKYSYGI